MHFIKLIILTYLSTILLTKTSAYSQVKKFKFGEITKEELSNKSYFFDSTAKAAILFDIGKDKIEIGTSNLISTRSRHVKIKIYTKEGISMANQIISIFNKFEKISLKGFTYNLENDKIIKTPIGNDNIFEERIIDDIVYKKVAFPNVKEGSVIELYYDLYSGSGFRYYYDWKFQYSFPVLYSEYQLKYPDISFDDANRLYFLKSGQGSLPLKQLDKLGEHYLLERIPALDAESHISTTDDFVSKIEFKLRDFFDLGDKYDTGTWEKLIDDLSRSSDFNIGFLNSVATANILKGILAGAKNNEEKAKAIYTYVKQNIKWNDRYGIFPTQNAEETLENKIGSVADINLLMLSLLSGAGIDANAVILSTRDHGKILLSFPVSIKFNYLICAIKINNELILLDATDQLMPFGMINPQAQNGAGILVKSSSEVQWINLSNVNTYSEKVNIVAEVNSEGSVKASIQCKETGLKAFESRKKIRLEDKKAIEKDLEKKIVKYDISNFEISEGQISETPFNIKYSIEALGEQEVKIHIEPMMAYKISDNIFNSTERKLPVDLAYKREEAVFFSLNIPGNYELIEIPKSINIMLPDKNTRFVYNVSINENKLQISSKLMMDKQLFFIEEYPDLRKFFEAVVMKHSEAIVLKKK